MYQIGVQKKDGPCPRVTLLSLDILSQPGPVCHVSSHLTPVQNMSLAGWDRRELEVCGYCIASVWRVALYPKKMALVGGGAEGLSIGTLMIVLSALLSHITHSLFT